ncbi:MAG: 1-acyl-sn-glycerol-3-phosphate acyltransferase [Bacteroidia bacterium]
MPNKKYREMTPEELALAIEENKKIYHEHFDPQFLECICREVIQLLDLYFRPVFVGFDELPERNNPDRPLIYACNHSGMAFPWDAIVFGMGLMARHEFQMEKLFRPLTAPMLSASKLMNPFLLRDIWKRGGAIDATGLNFETLMHINESNILIYPEGVPGIGKGFNNKYKLQPFSTSMIRMAIKYRTDIIGISCVNGEYINPHSYSVRPINKFIEKLGIPFLPVAFITPLLVVQPWLFYYAWPAKLTYVKGNRYSPWKMAGNRDIGEVSNEEILQIRDTIQADMQVKLDESVSLFGKKPYQWKELGKNLIRHWRRLPYWIPPGWPALFSEYDRRYYKDKELPSRITSGWFRFWYIVWKNPIVLAYFLPVVGWVPILLRGLKGREKVKPWEGPTKEH